MHTIEVATKAALRTLGSEPSGRPAIISSVSDTQLPLLPPEVDEEHSLLSAIAEGVLDDHLAAIAAAVDARRHLLHVVESSHALATLCTGDRVLVTGKVRPRYLAGMGGTVIALDEHTATVQLDFPVGRFTSGRVGIPPLALKKLSV
jgi:hypothetical protein